MARLQLPSVTLCAVSSVNIAATLEALVACSDQVDFAECLFLTDAAVGAPNPVRVLRIEPLASAEDYSGFLIDRLVQHVHTSHCLVVQWDGFVISPKAWDPHFLDFDYIGAPWPQFDDGNQVGNGGFSLRSRRLLQACQDPRFKPGHPEDVAICRTNRSLLEREHGIRFADVATAQRFAFERTIPAGPTFGFHGIFNMIEAVGADRFWKIYNELDDKRTAFVDFGLLVRQLRAGDQARRRQLRLSIDLVRQRLSRTTRSLSR